MSSSTTTSSSSVKSWTSSALNKSESVLSKLLEGFSSKYFYNIVLVGLILYAPLAAPKLSPSFSGLFNNYIVKLIYVFLLAYLVSNRNIKVAIVSSIVLVLGMFVLKRFDSKEGFDGDASETAKNSVEPAETRKVTFAEEDNMTQVTGIESDLSNISAEASHSDTLQPAKLAAAENIAMAQGPSEEVIDVCGSRLSKDGYTGYAETNDSLAEY